MPRTCNAQRRLIVCVSALLLTSLVLHASPPTLVMAQHGANTISGSTITNSPTGVTNGNTIVVGVSQTGADSDQSYSVQDDVNGLYTNAVGPIRSTGANGTRTCQIFYKHSVATTAGAITITTTASNGSVTARAQWLELQSGSGPIAIGPTDSVAGSADNTSQTGASGLTTPNDVFVYMVYALNATVGSFTATSSPVFTPLVTDFSANNSGSQYYSNVTGLTSNTLAYSIGTARTAASCTASFITSTAVARRIVGGGVFP